MSVGSLLIRLFTAQTVVIAAAVWTLDATEASSSAFVVVLSLIAVATGLAIVWINPQRR